jgi:hypothetical protein
MGMMTSPTSESTILPKAPPMITPTARSITLPLTANSLNSERSSSVSSCGDVVWIAAALTAGAGLATVVPARRQGVKHAGRGQPGHALG